MKEAVIVSAVRMPVGRLGGSLSGFRPEYLGGLIVKEAVKRANIDPEIIDELIFCSCENSDVKIVARVVSLEAELPLHIPSYQIQRGCASSLTALWDGVMMIKTGFADTIIAGGVESTSLAPYLMERPKRAYDMQPMSWSPPIFSPQKWGNLSLGQTAEEIAKRFGITREDCDEFSCESHRKGAAAYSNGYFDSQILSVDIPQKGGKTAVFNRDEPLRDDCNIESLSRLRPAFTKDGIVTAGNSSPLTDGASCAIVMEREKAESLGLPILAVFKDFADAGCDPQIMGEGPVHAVRKLLKKTGLTLDDIDLIELNEAFASQSLRCVRELGIDPDKLNVNGGAIALGHPFAATGIILVTKMVYEMNRRDAKRGIVTFCIGGGLGVAALFERP